MMAGGYCLSWTVWRVWLHPKRALRRIEEAEEREGNLQKRLEELLSHLEQQRKETSMQTIRATELSSKLSDTERRLTDEHHELEEIRLRLNKTMDSLAEHRSVEEQLKEFDRELSKVEEMKRNYEKRITELESRLSDARKRLKEADDNELSEPIDMLEEGRRQALIRQQIKLRRLKPHPSTPSASQAPESPPDTSEAASPDTQPQGASPSSDSPVKTPDRINVAPPEPGSVAEFLASLQKKARRAPDDWLSAAPDL